MEKSNEKILSYIFMAALLIATIFAGIIGITGAVRFDRARNTIDQLNERIITAERTNSELRGTIERCRQICDIYEKSVDRNVRTLQDAIEVVEQTRYTIQSIEMELGIWNTDSIYDGLDSWLESQGISVER